MSFDDPVGTTRRAIDRLDDPWSPEERRLAADLFAEFAATGRSINDPELLARRCLDAARSLLAIRHRRTSSR